MHLSNRFVKFKFVLIFISVLLSTVFLSCEADDESVDRIVVVSHGGTCEGFYMLNGGDAIWFTVNTLLEGSTTYYQYSANLESATSVNIHVDFSSTTYSTSSIIIYVYEDDTIADSTTLSVDSDTDISGSTYYYITGDLEYTFDADSE